MGADISKENSRREEAARSGQNAYPRHTATSYQQSRPANIQLNRPANTQPNRPANTQPSRPANTQPNRPVNTEPSRPATDWQQIATSAVASAVRTSGGRNETITQAQTPSTKYNYSKDELITMNRMSLYPNLNDGCTTNGPETTNSNRSDAEAVFSGTAQRSYRPTASPNVENTDSRYSRANSTPASVVRDIDNDYVFVNRNISQGGIPSPSAPVEDQLPQTSAYSASRTSGGRNETITQAQTPSTKYNYSKDELLTMNRMSLYPNLNDGCTTNGPETTNSNRSDADAVFSGTAQRSYRPTASPNVENTDGRYSRANSTPASVVRDIDNDYVFVNRNIRQGGIPSLSAPVEDQLPQTSAYSASRRPQSATARGLSTAGSSDQHRCACARLFGEEIYQCSKGHSACVECRNSGAGCRECGARVLPMRNYALEALIRDETGNSPQSATGNGPQSEAGNGPQSASAGAPNEYSCACGRAFGLEIYQCNNGHSACHECRNNGAGCRDCGMRILDMRNYAVEAHVRELKMECPNTGMGCSMRLRRVDMESHLLECIYREMDCPLAAVYGRCTWRGRRGVEMVRHFDERHAGARRVGIGEEATLFRLHLDERVVHLALLHNYFFLVHVKVSEADQTLRMAVQLLGTKVGAGKWKYEFHIYSKAETRRKFTYADACTADGDRIEDVFAECRCLTLPLAYAREFMGNRGLNYKFYITKMSEDGRPQRPGQRVHAPRGNSRVRNASYKA